jgi:peptidyl-prolyl cis-trans isomerase D
VARSAVAPAAIAGAALDPLLQRREVQFVRFDPITYREQVKPSDADIDAYYKAEAAKFKAPEQASIEYLTLDLDVMARNETVKEEDVQKFYAANAARFTAAEERRASHILINADKSLPAAARKEAKDKALALLAQARKNPGQFAELASKNSQDKGSATQGGDLGFFGRGAMVKPFEDAAFAMKVGDISEPIETEYGYHIITVVATKGGEKRALADVKTEIENELRKSAAKARWAAAAEQFTDLVYQQPDSLQAAMDKLKLEKKTATVLRTPAPGATGALASARFLEAVFGNEAVANKRNTDAIEVGANQLVAARVLQHSPARVLPLAEVKDRVRQAVVIQQAEALARKDGQAKLAALQQPGGATQELPGKALVSRAQPQNLPKEVLDAALRADSSKLPFITGVDVPGSGYTVLRVSGVQPRDPAAAPEDQLRNQYAQAWANAENDAYLSALKTRFKAEISPEAAKIASTAAQAASSPLR